MTLMPTFFPWEREDRRPKTEDPVMAENNEHLHLLATVIGKSGMEMNNGGGGYGQRRGGSGRLMTLIRKDVHPLVGDKGLISPC